MTKESIKYLKDKKAWLKFKANTTQGAAFRIFAGTLIEFIEQKAYLYRVSTFSWGEVPEPFNYWEALYTEREYETGVAW